MPQQLDTDYVPYVVFLSFGISFIGAYVGISLAENFRVNVCDTVKNAGVQGFLHYYYLFLMALSLGGVAIWCMHFIGMRAIMIRHPHSSEEISIRFNFGLSIASLIIVVLTTFAGLIVASRDRMFSKTKAEIMEMFVSDAKNLSISEIRKITATKMLIVIATKELGTLILGGVITSVGVCIMHYLGMVSMIFEGNMEWNIGLVALSVIIAAVASSAAFWILFRLLSIFPEMEWLRLASAFIMALAVNGMHYTGVGAAEFFKASSRHHQGDHWHGLSMDDSRAFLGALVASNVFVWLLAHSSISNSRSIIHHKSKQLREAKEVLNRLSSAMASGANSSAQRLLENYFKREEKRNQDAEAKALASVTHTMYRFVTKWCGCGVKGVAPDGSSMQSEVHSMSFAFVSTTGYNNTGNGNGNEASFASTVVTRANQTLDDKEKSTFRASPIKPNAASSSCASTVISGVTDKGNNETGTEVQKEGELQGSDVEGTRSAEMV